MKKLAEVIQTAGDNKIAIGHFNISNLETLWAVFRAGKEANQPLIIGVSEGERDFIGVRQARALVSSLRDEFDYPIFLNADHTYSFERVKEVIDAGYDSVIFDGSQLPLEENIRMTKQCVDYARSVNPDILVEGELGYIGTSSKLLDELPTGAAVTEETITTAIEAENFVKETGVDLLAPAVGNIHGMLKNSPDPRLNIARIRAIRQAAGVPLVLHGGSGTADEDFTAAIKAGMPVVHISTELRVAYKNGLKRSLQEFPDEIAPYKILKEPMMEMKDVALKRIRLFSQT